MSWLNKLFPHVIFTPKDMGPDYIRSSYLKVKLDKGTIERLTRIQQFLLLHQGSDHSVYVVKQYKKQTLVCSCGQPHVGDLSQGTLDVPAVWLEEDLVDP